MLFISHEFTNGDVTVTDSDDWVSERVTPSQMDSYLQLGTKILKRKQFDDFILNEGLYGTFVEKTNKLLLAYIHRHKNCDGAEVSEFLSEHFNMQLYSGIGAQSYVECGGIGIDYKQCRYYDYMQTLNFAGILFGTNSSRLKVFFMVHEDWSRSFTYLIQDGIFKYGVCEGGRAVAIELRNAGLERHVPRINQNAVYLKWYKGDLASIALLDLMESAYGSRSALLLDNPERKVLGVLDAK